jgi:hypothetical protein
MSACDLRGIARVRAAVAPTADQVAEMIGGMRSVEEANEALQTAGYRSAIVGNRIAVNNRVMARHVAASSVTSHNNDIGWVVYGVGEQPAVRIVVPKRQPVSGQG